MNYDIQTESSPSHGTSLAVKIPTNEVDYKALNTIQTDKPKFILPFHSKTVDNHVELTYLPGSHSKLHSFSGNFPVRDYAELWHTLLSPFMDCGDWFLNPYSFVLDCEYIYWDIEKNTVAYLYIPSTKNCSDHFKLREMAAAFSSRVTVAESEIEVKVLRMILTDFNPKVFLKMLKPYIITVPPVHITQSNPHMNTYTVPTADIPLSTQFSAQPSSSDSGDIQASGSDKNLTDELIINLFPENSFTEKSKAQKETLKDMGIPNTGREKRGKQKKTPNPDSFFNRLRGGGKDIIIER